MTEQKLPPSWANALIMNWRTKTGASPDVSDMQIYQVWVDCKGMDEADIEAVMLETFQGQ